MQSLYSPKTYPAEIRSKIESMPPLATEIANRWMLGWPKTVKELIAAGQYLEALKNQEREEREVLSNPGLQHLARHEIVQEYGLSLSPPSVQTPIDIPTTGPWNGPPHCVLEASEHEVDGKRVRAIVSRFSDGFTCLRFEDVEDTAIDAGHEQGDCD